MTARPVVVCLGAAHWDLLARAAAPLAAGADVPGRVTSRSGGVALNIAAALAALGSAPVLVAAVGRDAEGDRLAEAAAAAGIATGHLHRHPGTTDTYLAIETGAGALHAAVADCAGLEREADALLDRLGLALAGAAALVVDGNLPERVIARLPAHLPLALVAASPAKAARLRPALGHPTAILYANLAEAAAILDMPLADSAEAAEALAAAGVPAALVTDGPREAAWMAAGGVILRQPPAVTALRVTGAGDALVAAHLHARLGGARAGDALDAALAAAAIHVSRE